MRLDVEEARRRTVDIKHADVAIFAMKSGREFLVIQPQHIDPLPFAADAILQIAIEMQRDGPCLQQRDLPVVGQGWIICRRRIHLEERYRDVYPLQRIGAHYNQRSLPVTTGVSASPPHSVQEPS